MKTLIKSAFIILIVSTVACSSKKEEEIKSPEVQETIPLKTVQIGNQIWTAENLDIKTDSGSWIYYDDDYKANIYGRLYDWETAVRMSPEGFRLPTLEDWNALIDYYGTYDVIAGSLKSVNTWSEPSKGNSETNSLNLLPGGLRNSEGGYFGEEFSSFYWTATEAGAEHAYYINLDYDKEEVLQDMRRKTYGFSVRYIKN